MCLHPEEIPPVPEETARVANAAFPKGNMYMCLRDEMGIFFQDQDGSICVSTKRTARTSTLAISDVTDNAIRRKPV